MPRGGDRGGRKPFSWRLLNGERPDMGKIDLPKYLKPEARKLIRMIDKGELTLEQIEWLKEALKTRSIDELKKQLNN